MQEVESNASLFVCNMQEVESNASLFVVICRRLRAMH
jgi:hypothetical protein